METLNLSKSYDFFKPEEVKERIHIIGCGSVGSCVAELLARFGITKMTLYDFDVVEPKNLANQMFRQEHIGLPKTEALADIIREINPECVGNLLVEREGYTGQRLSGYVFLAVDNIELRREIATANKDNPYIKAMFDFCTRLTDAQHYAADWGDMKMVGDFIKSMNFTHEEAAAETPVSACNVTLSVAPTIRITSQQLGVLASNSKDVFLDSFIHVVPYGDFVKKKDAVRIIEGSDLKRKSKAKMLRLLELIPKKKSLLLAQRAMGERDIEKIMKMFEQLSLSPVTISKRQDVNILETLYLHLFDG